MFARSWHALTALLIVAALAVQVLLAVRAPGSPPGHDVGTLAGAPLAGRLLRVTSFFTIQSNLLIAIRPAERACGDGGARRGRGCIRRR